MAFTSKLDSWMFGREKSGRNSERIKQFTELFSSISGRGYVPWSRTHAAGQSSSESEVKNEKNQFQILLNVNHFNPDEIEVKVVDNYISVHGKHEELSDEHGFIQREFTRRYLIPEGIEADTIKSSWIIPGLLTIEAAKKEMETPASYERVVPISLFSMSENKASN